ncbi:carbamoyltransferase HypF [Nostoc sp. 'Lobaria pulmonaria (5183) cyanobiont']|uniref:carbamoyltransferase HypF n=1 Tax=Nostoc sp. 'Lobaria pulmonaria (5183) cyanobiont' TaxID=1618022 RepID=UPI000CF35372|nr:carbamoyltransferase HypF [Nostoc sp. 'Lobaria pulmonaria (5183) cyanobiont']AVH73095.1 carbamoyltransferase/hydrogenase maturation protein HypF [Nostoc sp. 'Lobaria pulmonaria (5183) cyanobiont']
MPTEEIRVNGTVQGVGFRPTVYRLAKACGLRGDVCNDGQGVLIKVSGSEEEITKFIARLQTECPPLAKINQIIRTPYEGELKFDNFVISTSVSNAIKTEITPDAATCSQCQQEIFDPFSRFYRYPFTNCTHCGPRLSIIRAIPYDRCNTSMSAFAICPECAKEYHDVENRRFHAQPVACYVCGPTAWLERADGKSVTASMFSMLDDVDAVCTLLQKGEIVAIKGLGGIHLACDATQETVVQKLRQRKRRYYKPFALMARDIEVIEEYCTVNAKEKELLASSAAPIVLLQATGKKVVASSIASGQNSLGFMLPYTPLHHLILRRMNRPIVLTSGNLADEPQCIDNQEARNKLGTIADYFLFHNREIINRVDDSVVRVTGNKAQTIRRARGYAPAPISLPPGFHNVPQILAMGSELKNTFCLLREGEAIISQHLGDLENAAAFNAYQETLNLYLNLFEHQPKIITFDKHPEYLSSKLGKQLAKTNQIPIHQIQHHHAHIAACMAENEIPLDSPPILGIALDGLGYGDDGTLWGGEFLLADYRKFQRLATFKPVVMIGGEQAIYQPWRNTYAQLIAANLWDDCQQQYADLEIIKFLKNKPLNLLNQLIEKKINSPPASSVGRLFDAVAAAIGIYRDECSYEGQAAIAMEAIVDVSSLNNHKETPIYPFNFSFSDSIYCIDPRPMWQALLNDLQQQIPEPVIAAKFHKGLANAIVEMVKYLCQENLINQVALTGGVFQNCILLEQVTKRLQTLGIKVLTHSLVPANDGGLSLGQAVIAAAQLIH